MTDADVELLLCACEQVPAGLTRLLARVYDDDAARAAVAKKAASRAHRRAPAPL